MLKILSNRMFDPMSNGSTVFGTPCTIWVCCVFLMHWFREKFVRVGFLGINKAKGTEEMSKCLTCTGTYSKPF